MVSGIFDRMLDREGGLFLKSIYEIEIPITCVRDTYSDTIKAPITDHDLRIIFTKSIYTCLLSACLYTFALPNHSRYMEWHDF